MQQHGCTDVPSTLQPRASLLRAIYALYWRDTFLGSCVAISDTVLLSAGHHYHAVKDNVGDFSVLVGDAQWTSVSYMAKNSAYDVLVLWLSAPVPCHVALRGFLPPVGARVATTWLSPRPPHEPVTSPGVVVESGVDGCIVRGTVSTRGSSGAPVLDFYGEHVVGLHLTSNTRGGSRVSGFVPSRKLVPLLAEMSISCR